MIRCLRAQLDGARQRWTLAWRIPARQPSLAQIQLYGFGPLTLVRASF